VEGIIQASKLFLFGAFPPGTHITRPPGHSFIRARIDLDLRPLTSTFLDIT